MQMTLDVSINAPPSTVFATVVDIPSWPSRISAITRIDMLTEGPIAPGTRFRETRMMFGREAAEEMTVAELAPPTLFVLTARNHGTAYRVTHRFSPEGAATRLTMVFEGQPLTLMARLLAPIGWLMSGTVKRQIANDLADLKRAVEGAASGPQ